jgi:dipeptidyl aminopeptidase/acylaminoacyl peptidase
LFVYFSRHGKYRVIGVNEDARTRVEIFDNATGKPLALPSLPEGQIANVTFSRNEDLMSFYFNGDHTPANLFLFDLKSKSVKQLTDTQNPAIDPADLVDSQVIRYKSFDGMEIPAILYKPQQASAEAKAPALVWVHGGPGGQSGRGYSNLLQYFVNHGYVVLAVNNRGSSGYGKTFFQADEKRHGHEPLWDCVEAKKYLNSLDYVEANRIGIIGGSYGGYMTLAALTLKPKEFVVGVDLFGISNWVRTLESIPPWWEAQKEALYKKIGDPKKDRDMLLTVSPLFNADKVERPLMILQGANDPRVIKVESDDMVAAIKKKGGIVEYMVFPDEGHGFTKRENQIKGYGAILVFLDEYLKGAQLARRN